MTRCWHELLKSLALFWRTLAIIFFAAALFGGLFINLPGVPVLWSDLYWMLSVGVLLTLVHVIFIALAHRSTVRS